MLKSTTPYITYIILSILVIVFAKYINNFIICLAVFYDYINDHLSVLFNKSAVGILSRNTISLVICPLIITGTPALIYYAFKRSKMPYFIEITWLSWLTLVLSNLLVK